MSNLQVIPLHSYRQLTQPAAAPPATFNYSKQRRRRGILLTHQGWQKLHQSQVLCNEFGERHTLEYLSEKTLLDPRTIYRIIGREVAVDKRSLVIFFNAFNLELSQEDYTIPPVNRQPAQTERQTVSFNASTLMDEDVAYFKRQIIESYHGLIQCLNLDSNNSITLSVNLTLHAPPQLKLHL
ncbi:MAG: hypothetical protein KME45_07640 [Stenomitos rutilans HA7619-LM2]|jgi:hypothetical protein|nr:hypothetical protein [Stenomitos rutilans HA7619-LM2]